MGNRMIGFALMNAKENVIGSQSVATFNYNCRPREDHRATSPGPFSPCERIFNAKLSAPVVPCVGVNGLLLRCKKLARLRRSKAQYFADHDRRSRIRRSGLAREPADQNAGSGPPGGGGRRVHALLRLSGLCADPGKPVDGPLQHPNRHARSHLRQRNHVGRRDHTRGGAPCGRLPDRDFRQVAPG